MNRRFCNGMVHVIKEGENLYQLSRAYRVPLALLLRANPYVDVYNLQVGQEICIPVARPFGGMMRPPMGRPGRPQRPQEIQSRDGMRMPEEDSDDREEREERLEEARERLEDERVRLEEEREHREEMQRRETEERRDIPEMMEQAEEERDTDSHVSDGMKSFGAILRESGMTPEMFFAINDPNQITIAADVIYELPKKV